MIRIIPDVGMEQSNGEGRVRLLSEPKGEVIHDSLDPIARPVDPCHFPALTKQGPRLHVTVAENLYVLRKVESSTPPGERIMVPMTHIDADPALSEPFELVSQAGQGTEAAIRRVVHISRYQETIGFALDRQVNDVLKRLKRGLAQGGLQSRGDFGQSSEGRIQMQVGAMNKAKRRHGASV